MRKHLRKTLVELKMRNLRQYFSQNEKTFQKYFSLIESIASLHGELLLSCPLCKCNSDLDCDHKSLNTWNVSM